MVLGWQWSACVGVGLKARRASQQSLLKEKYLGGASDNAGFRFWVVVRYRLPINPVCDLFSPQLVLLNQLLNVPSCASAELADAADVFGLMTPPSFISSVTSLVSRASLFVLQHPNCAGPRAAAAGTSFSGNFTYFYSTFRKIRDSQFLDPAAALDRGACSVLV